MNAIVITILNEDDLSVQETRNWAHIVAEVQLGFSGVVATSGRVATAEELAEIRKQVV